MMNDNDNKKKDIVDRKFVRYPILHKSVRRYYHSAHPKTKISHIKKEFRSESFNKILNIDSPNSIRIALFPGWENFYNFNNFEESSRKNYSLRFVPPIVIPAIGEKEIKLENLQKVRSLHSSSPQNSFNIWTISMGLKSHIELGCSKYKPKRSMSRMMYFIGREMVEVHKFDFWDEKQLYRFYTMNAFLGDQHDDKTYGEFVFNNEEELWDNYRSLSNAYNNKHTINFYMHFLKLDSILNYFHLNSEKSEPLINNLTKDQIHYVIDNEKKFPKIGNSGSGYFEKLEKSIENLKNINDDAETVKYDRLALSKTILESISKSLKKYDFDTNFKDIKVFDNHGNIGFAKNTPDSIDDERLMLSLYSSAFDFANTKIIYQQATRVKITKELNDNWDKFELWEIVAFLYVLANPKYMFNRAGEKGYSIIVKSIDKFGIEVVVPFISEIMMDCNGELPTYSDWKKFLDEGGKLENEITPSLFLFLMLDKDRDQVRKLDDIVKDRNFVKQVQKICDK